MGATVNDEHVGSLVSYIARGAVPRSEYVFGVEIEHLPIRNGTGAAVDLYSENGVEDFLRALRPRFEPEEETWENGHLLGLRRGKIDVSTEPGAQVETALGPVKSPAEAEELYAQFRTLADPILTELNFDLVPYGYQPRTPHSDVRILPTGRYRVLDEYFGTVGSYGLLMMRCSASTQVSIDFSSEADSVRKMRLGSAAGPLLGWFFRNSPYFESGPSPLPLMRQEMWERTDPQRTGLTPGLFSDGFGWEDYAVNMLSTPLMVADMGGTPEHEGREKVFTVWHENAADIYPDRALNDYEMAHILSTHFNDVRLKQFLEFRHWDSLPIDRVRRLMEIVESLFCDDAQLDRLQHLLGGVREVDVLAAKADIQASGAQARPYGHSLEQWRELLGLRESDETDAFCYKLTNDGYA
jgi:glutamate--cysteine ligase